MPPAPPPLTELVDALRERYGAPEPPAVTDPFAMVLHENVAYLVDDERRARVFGKLQSEVGLAPESLLDVPAPALAQIIAEGGMHPVRRATKLHVAAEVALAIGLVELRRVVREDPAAARRLLKRFPGFGNPGAEKVLLFNGAWKGLAPDSNALRVLVRVGYGAQAKDYGKTYRSVAAAVEPLLPDDDTWLVAAHRLLRTHGQELCKHSSPRCEACPLSRRCAWRAENPTE